LYKNTERFGALLYLTLIHDYYMFHNVPVAASLILIFSILAITNTLRRAVVQVLFLWCGSAVLWYACSTKF